MQITFKKYLNIFNQLFDCLHAEFYILIQRININKNETKK